MGHVSFNLNGRTYRFACGEGDEARIRALAGYVQTKLDEAGDAAGRSGDDRLLVMAALMIADEVFDLRQQGENSPPALRPRKTPATIP